MYSLILMGRGFHAYSPPKPCNRVSVWVSGGSNYVYETNKSEREAETEATQDTPFSPVKSRSPPAYRRAALESLSARKPKSSLRPLPKKPNVDCRVLPLAGQRGQELRYAIEAEFEVVDATADAAPPRLVALTCWLVAWQATGSGMRMAASVPDGCQGRSGS